jgi:AraC family transcriptional regulator
MRTTTGTLAEFHRHHTGEHANAMLAKRDLSITEIGPTVGFSETSSFSAAFRKATGIAYRKRFS